VTQCTEGATIRFDATLTAVGTSTVLRLPQTASNHLPSRGQVAVHGTINGIEFQTVLEPDGNSGHWMRVDDTQVARVIHAAAKPAMEPSSSSIQPTACFVNLDSSSTSLSDTLFQTFGIRAKLRRYHPTVASGSNS
jgi:hypothetical protein